MKSRFASFPSFPGKLRLIDVASEVARWFGGREKEVCLWEDVKFSVDLADRVQRQMWFGCYEPHVTRALRQLLRLGDTFLDMGAHVGYHSYFAAGLVGSGGHVYAFEADPGNIVRLKKNLESFRQAAVYQCAVWSHEERLLFERSASNTESGWGTLANIRSEHRGEQVEVDAISLDEWTKQSGVKTIRAAKIDVEGPSSPCCTEPRAFCDRFDPYCYLK